MKIDNNKSKHQSAPSPVRRAQRVNEQTETVLDLGPGFVPSSTPAILWQLGPAIGVLVPSSVRYTGSAPRIKKTMRNEQFPGWTLLHVSHSHGDEILREVTVLLRSAPSESERGAP